MASLTVSNDKAFQIGDEVFFSGSDSIAVGFDFDGGVHSLNIQTKDERGNIIETIKDVSAKDFSWKLRRENVVQSYTMAFQFFDAFGDESEWQDIATVHNVARMPSPTKISTHRDLLVLSARVNFGFDDYKGVTVQLENDLVLPDMDNNYSQIGNDTNPAFCGTFDGRSHTISNLRMFAKNTSLGVFNDFRGTLRDLEISGSIHVDGDEDSDITAAGFALSLTDATVMNVKSNMNVTVNSESAAARASGFWGRVSGKTTVIGSTYSGTITSPGAVSGFAVSIDQDASFNLINSVDEGKYKNASGEQLVPMPLDDYSVTVPPGVDATRLYSIDWINYDGSKRTTYEFFNARPTLPAPPTRPGDHVTSYQFAGWQTSGGRAVSNVTGNAVYYANYNTVRTVHTLTWMDHNGQVWRTTQAYFNEMPVLVPNPTRPDTPDFSYEFVGWNTAPQQSTYDLQVVSPGVVTNSVTYYAIYRWVSLKNRMTVVYNANFPAGAVTQGVAPASRNVVHGGLLAIGAHSMQAEGYNLIGWAVDKNARFGDVTTVYIGDYFISNANEGFVTLYAIWAKTSDTVITTSFYIENTLLATRAAVAGAPMALNTITAPAFADNSYFAGWSLTRGGSILPEQYIPGTSVSVYAVFGRV